MLVCICKGVSHTRIESAIEEGASSLKAIAKCSGAGTGKGCGMCHQELKQMLTRDDRQSACQSMGSVQRSAT